jgi:hypothetical protein
MDIPTPRQRVSGDDFPDFWGVSFRYDLLSIRGVRLAVKFGNFSRHFGSERLLRSERIPLTWYRRSLGGSGLTVRLARIAAGV